MNETGIRKEAVKQTNLELKAVFEIDQGTRKKTLMVRKDRVVIGSVESADIKLEGSKIAPIHAFLELVWGDTAEACSARIIDLASPTGVTVNGKKAVNEPVRTGDKIQIGDAIFRFSFSKPEFQNTLPDQALLLIDANEVKPIFDYRPPVKEALEVVYSWNSVILDVKHFVGEQEVVLGSTKKEDFLVPPVFSSGSNLTLARKSGNQCILTIDPNMKGVLYLKGELHAIETYAKGQVTLSENDFAKIDAGTISFYTSQTVAPPVMRNQTTVIADPFLAKSLLTSIALTALLLFAVSRMEVQPVEEKVPETIATILYHPEKYSIKRPRSKPEPKTEEKKPEPPVAEKKPKKTEIDFTKPKEKTGKVAQTKSPQPGRKQSAESQAKEGAGARAKGEEGSRGNRHASPSNTHKTAANRPSPQAGEGRGGTISQTQDNGNVQMLQGATNKILDLLGGSGQQLGKSGSKLSGFGGFSTQGSGGAALQGQGKGGGGNADTLLGGTSDHGRGGGKVGTGLGAEGTGAGIVGGRTRVDLNLGGGEETVVVGAIDRDAIDAAIRAHRYELQYCHEREMNAGHPNLSGKIVTAFVIGGSGRASQLAIASSSMGNATVERCVLSVIARIQFPLPAGGVPVTIKYPFNFNNASK